MKTKKPTLSVSLHENRSITVVMNKNSYDLLRNTTFSLPPIAEAMMPKKKHSI